MTERDAAPMVSSRSQRLWTVVIVGATLLFFAINIFAGWFDTPVRLLPLAFWIVFAGFLPFLFAGALKVEVTGQPERGRTIFMVAMGLFFIGTNLLTGDPDASDLIGVALGGFFLTAGAARLRAALRTPWAPPRTTPRTVLGPLLATLALVAVVSFGLRELFEPWMIAALFAVPIAAAGLIAFVIGVGNRLD